jgi:hypothetical protein
MRASAALKRRRPHAYNYSYFRLKSSAPERHEDAALAELQFGRSLQAPAPSPREGVHVWAFG